jgi:hypothetical protein
MLLHHHVDLHTNVLQHKSIFSDMWIQKSAFHHDLTDNIMKLKYSDKMAEATLQQVAPFESCSTVNNFRALH